MTTELNAAPNRRRKTSKTTARMKSDARRRQLIEISKALFAEKGFNGTTTKEIAARAEITEALIFRHFAAKEALYEAVVADKGDDRLIDDFCRELAAAAERRDDEKVFETAARIVLHRYQSKRDILRILIFGILENRPHITERFESEIFPLRRFLADYITQRQEEGVFYTSSPELAVFGFIGMVTHHTMLGELISEQKKVASDRDALRFFTQMMIDCLKTK